VELFVEIDAELAGGNGGQTSAAPLEWQAPESAGDCCKTLAMACVAKEKWRELYEPEQGFARGTLFSELDFPFSGEGACAHGS
jgi:hypothetical protein